MFQSKHGAEWEPHPVLAGIENDDPELMIILAGIKTPVVSINQMIEAGPHKRTVIYGHIAAGLLRTWTSMGRRHAFAVDYAKYLLSLKRLEWAGEKPGPGQRLSPPAIFETRVQADPSL